ncbi:MAG: type II toxin-antitoxin system PemK/MazF family toxin [Anaerolineae bacterium]|nr:type II toxin-antitoxin system PemK/MazF family toxin [Anaerolineae bacterium]
MNPITRTIKPTTNRNSPIVILSRAIINCQTLATTIIVPITTNSSHRSKVNIPFFLNMGLVASFDKLRYSSFVKTPSN